MKAGDVSGGPRGKTESRDVRRDGRGLACSDAVECRGEWVVACEVMRTVTRSHSSKTAVGVSTEGSQQRKRSIVQRVF